MANDRSAVGKAPPVARLGGEVGALIREREWSLTPLGPEASWPASLKTTLRLMLSTRYPTWLGWGPDLAFFYNDAYAAETLGPRHPWALGRPAAEVWAEIWQEIQPRIDHVLETGEATWDEGLLLFLERNGYPEETYHTFSYSPAPGDRADEIGGLFCVVAEETERVIGERRIALLRDLAALLAPTKTPSEVFTVLERFLEGEARDIPFSLVYLFDDEGQIGERCAAVGFAGKQEPRTWPFAAVLEGGATVTVPLDAEVDWPKGAWKRAPSHALVVPIAQPGQGRPAGVFVAGVNPHRPLDANYQSFIELFVSQLAAALANTQAYEAEKKRADALAEVDRAKTAFFSNVSHEFRTPLTLMLGPTEDALSSPERALRGVDLETVHRNELRLLKLVNVLLDFARIEAGRVKAWYAPTDLTALTIDLASSFRSAIERAGLGFDVECETLDEPVYVDHDMWEKIVLNLLSNALKFTFAGRIGVRLRREDRGVALEIADTGVGIAKDELPRLFERFHRIEGVRARTHEGSGIGLALVHELVRLHGGTIDVESELEKGTRFTLRIPLGVAHLPADRIGVEPTAHVTGAVAAAYVAEALRWTPGATVKTPDSGASAPRPSSTARILVADDNADMRDYVARILRQHWTVDTANDGADALDKARAASPDLVLSDVMMPRLDGFGLVKELRADPRTKATPVILLSARAGEEATAEGLRAGADDYLVKPFSASSLLVRIEAQLSAARLRRAERERFELMVRESPSAIGILHGRSLIIELANPRLLEVWGRGPEVLGKPLLEVLPELHGQGFDVRLRQVLDSGVPYRSREARVRLDRKRNGEPLADLEESYFDYVFAPISDDEGRPEAVFVDAYEVTDKVKARRHLEHLREVAESANRVKDEFLATMSHELRTPLNAILGWASLLRRPNAAVDVERATATIERNAKAQAHLIDDMLDVSRIISGKLRLEPRPVDLEQIVHAAVEVIRPTAQAKGIEVTVEATAPGTVLMADPDRLQQVVWNLLANAVKFSSSGGAVRIRTEVEAVDAARSVARIIVADRGAGIGPEHLPFVFERFRQADSSMTRRHGGLGLGLAIVRHMVELHGGDVSASSDGVGQGATFTVELPLSSLREPIVAPAPITSRSSPVPGLLAGLEVLIVDDDADSRLFLEIAIERAGGRVRSADSAIEAFAFLERQGRTVDVLISDIGMPGEDGLSLLRRIRALPAEHGGKVPAIALTAYARTDDAARALASGFQRHVAKPADADELVRAVASVVGR